MFKIRLITTLILGTAVFFSLLLPSLYFQLLIGVVLLITVREFAQLIALDRVKTCVYCLIAVFIYGFTCYYNFSITQCITCLALVLIYLLGVVFYSLWSGLREKFKADKYCVLSIWGIVSLVSTAQVFVWLQANQLFFLGMLIVTVAGLDTGGYVFGKLWGRKQLAPRISPKKTWAGLYGGIITALIFNGIYFSMLADPGAGSLLFMVIVSLVLAPVSVIGDLFESLLKRRRGLKDSGNIIPGHGGIMDRIDGLILAAPVYFILLTIYS